jgi:hypothetical protein
MLLDISLEATRVVLTAFIILGTIGNILNLLIFTRPARSRSSCILYLIAASIDNLLVIYTALLIRLISSGYSYNVTVSDLMCKLRYYLSNTFLAVSPYFFILACFDRYCSSSVSVRRRSWCNRKIAKRFIIAAVILACILYLHLAIFVQMTISGTSIGCATAPGFYTYFYRIFYLVIYCILPPVSMGVLCILTLINIREQAQRIRPALVSGGNNLRRMDRQMMRMLFSQVLTQLLCILPFATINLVGLFVDTSTTIYTFFEQIFILPLFVSYTTSFYVFTLSSRIYRKELMRIICFWKRRRPENIQTIRTIATGTTTRKQQNTNTNRQQR